MQARLGCSDTPDWSSWCFPPAGPTQEGRFSCKRPVVAQVPVQTPLPDRAQGESQAPPDKNRRSRQSAGTGWQVTQDLGRAWTQARRPSSPSATREGEGRWRFMASPARKGLGGGEGWRNRFPVSQGTTAVTTEGREGKVENWSQPPLEPCQLSQNKQSET